MKLRAWWTLVGIAVLATAPMSWPDRAFACAWELAALALALAVCIQERGSLRMEWTSGCLLAAAAWGAVQWHAGFTVSPERTAGAVAQWTGLGALIFAAENILRSPGQRERFLRGAAAAGALAAAVCLAQPHVTGISYDEMAGPFQNRNTYCSLVELLLPVVVWLASKDKAREWAWWMAAAGMAASVIATGSRAGTALTAVEFLVLMLVSRQRRAFAVAGGLAAVWIVAAGWDTLAWRVWLEDPAGRRSEMIGSAIRMAVERPFTGFGLGAFIDAYAPFATFDVGRLVNHAHNDWAEWASEGGFLLPLLLAAPWLVSIRRAKLWALGIPFVFLHSLVDYPMQRPGLSVWVWLIVAAAASQPRLKQRAARAGPARESRGRVRQSDRFLATAGR